MSYVTDYYGKRHKITNLFARKGDPVPIVRAGKGARKLWRVALLPQSEACNQWDQIRRDKIDAR